MGGLSCPCLCVIARDLKPENILFTPSAHPTPQRPGTFCIADLGSALPCNTAKAEVLSSKRKQGFTTAYMPP